MPRYFFELQDGARSEPDDDGLEFPDLNAAIADCCGALGQMAKDKLGQGSGPQRLAIVVRDESGGAIMRAAFNFELRPLFGSVGPQ